jgi:hypothetical protein
MKGRFGITFAFIDMKTSKEGMEGGMKSALDAASRSSEAE